MSRFEKSLVLIRGKLRLAALFTLVTGAFFLLPACADKPTLLRVGTNIWPGYECLYLARSLGQYDPARIRLVEYPSASAVIRAYRNGAIEAAAVTMDEALLLVEQRQAGVMTLIMDVSEGADVIMAKPGIGSIAELKGKKVGVETGALGAYMLTRALNYKKMSLYDIHVVPLEHNEHERAYLEGKVDALVTFEPVTTRLKKAGGRILFDSAMIPEEIVDVLVVRQEVLEEQNESVLSLFQGWFYALEYLKKNPKDAAKRMAARENISPEELLQLLKGIRFPDINENLVMLSGEDPSFRKTVGMLSDIMYTNKILFYRMDPNPLVTSSVIEQMVE
ncbi:MAG: ABC transporter substrate-binding protein [Nitrospinae bacterium]|nr:ABC transporter substrate-binding protein [Nitrospinota bacterium]